MLNHMVNNMDNFLHIVWKDTLQNNMDQSLQAVKMNAIVNMNHALHVEMDNIQNNMEHPLLYMLL